MVEESLGASLINFSQAFSEWWIPQMVQYKEKIMYSVILMMADDEEVPIAAFKNIEDAKKFCETNNQCRYVVVGELPTDHKYYKIIIDYDGILKYAEESRYYDKQSYVGKMSYCEFAYHTNIWAIDKQQAIRVALDRYNIIKKYWVIEPRETLEQLKARLRFSLVPDSDLQRRLDRGDYDRHYLTKDIEFEINSAKEIIQ